MDVARGQRTLMMDQLMATFVAECRELLGEMESSLLGLGRGGDDAEAVNAIFRAAHTIKGNAGIFGLDDMVRFTHAVESVLDAVRTGRLTTSDDLVALMLQCADHTSAHLEAVIDEGTDRVVALADREAQLLAALAALLAPERTTATATAATLPEPEVVFFDDEPSPTGVGASAAPPAAVETRPAAAGPAPEPASGEVRTVRVDAERLDRLIDLVGELIISSARAELLAKSSAADELKEATSNMTGLVAELRDSALQLRMVKIGATFHRFRRVVHDVARDLGKDVALEVSGENTELDKTVVEKIADPLTHLIRNAMDHGIEPTTVRVERGKPARGTVRLHAHHDSGSIVIEVSDDGGGLSRDRILAKGIERGLVEPGRSLTDSEIFALIMEPGLSTAETVTNLSGRGVGMDVVKRNITALRGTVAINSSAGEGTTVVVRLPLTLAIINGFRVVVGRSSFVVPLELVEECMEVDVPPGRKFVDLRGDVLPFVRLRDIVGGGGAPARRESLVVVRHGATRVGLVVDALGGELQTVIKPLARMFGNADILSGSTILGSGEVALILDVPAIVTHAMRADTLHSTTPQSRRSDTQEGMTI